MRFLPAALLTFTLATALGGCTSTPGTTDASASRPPTATAATSATPSTTAQTGTSTTTARRPATGNSRSSLSPPGVARSQPLVLTYEGMAGVPVGSTLDEFAAALDRSPTPMSASDRGMFTDYRCVYRQFVGLPGVGFMVIGDDPAGQVRLIAIGPESTVRTTAGIGPGSSLDDIRAAYGPQVERQVEHSIQVRAGSGRYFQFTGDDQDQVVTFTLGLKPEVDYYDGCV